MVEGGVEGSVVSYRFTLLRVSPSTFLSRLLVARLLHSLAFLAGSLACLLATGPEANPWHDGRQASTERSAVHVDLRPGRRLRAGKRWLWWW